MAKIDVSLNELLEIDGAVGGCIVDYTSGMSLGSIGAGVDILITLDTQLHVIRPTTKHEGLFIYLVLDKSKANLALARRKVQSIENNLEV